MKSVEAGCSLACRSVARKALSTSFRRASEMMNEGDSMGM
jgi:hypothetical protein